MVWTSLHLSLFCERQDLTLARWLALARVLARAGSQSAAQEGQKLVRELAQKDQELVQSQQALSKAQRVIALLQLELAGKRAASIQSLLATAKRDGLDSAAWLQQTLDKLPTCLNSHIDELLPFAR
jgi:hypothetical protein